MTYYVSLLLVPCRLEDVQASVACVTGELTLTWNNSVPSENYTAVISRGMGQPLHCNSTETQCTVGGLACGSTYMVTVFSVTGTCFSRPSTEVTVQTCERCQFAIIKDVDTAAGIYRTQFQTIPFVFIPLQCHVLPPTSQPCTHVLQILFLCHGWPATVPNTTLLSL